MVNALCNVLGSIKASFLAFIKLFGRFFLLLSTIFAIFIVEYTNLSFVRLCNKKRGNVQVRMNVALVTCNFLKLAVQ